MKTVTLNKEFFEYLHALEHALILKPELWRDQSVSKKSCKLSKQQFGQILGATFDCNINCVIDYFGLLRKSTGFLLEALRYPDASVPTRLLYFQSIKIETVFTVDPVLVAYFPVCKSKIIAIRQFKSS